MEEKICVVLLFPLKEQPIKMVHREGIDQKDTPIREAEAISVISLCFPPHPRTPWTESSSAPCYVEQIQSKSLSISNMVL